MRVQSFTGRITQIVHPDRSHYPIYTLLYVPALNWQRYTVYFVPRCPRLVPPRLSRCDDLGLTVGHYGCLLLVLFPPCFFFHRRPAPRTSAGVARTISFFFVPYEEKLFLTLFLCSQSHESLHPVFSPLPCQGSGKFQSSPPNAFLPSPLFRFAPFVFSPQCFLQVLLFNDFPPPSGFFSFFPTGSPRASPDMFFQVNHAPLVVSRETLESPPTLFKGLRPLFSLSLLSIPPSLSVCFF